MRDEHNEVRRLRDLLPGAARRAGLDDDAVEIARLLGDWRSIVGPAIAEHAEPTSLRRGTLRVRTDSPAWATEISYFADQIRTRLNAAAGRALVSEVRVWTGPREPAFGSRSAPRTEPAPGGGERAAPAEPLEALERARRAWSRRRSRAVENRRKSR